MRLALGFILLFACSCAYGATAVSDTFSTLVTGGIPLSSHVPNTDEVGGGWVIVNDCADLECYTSNNELVLDGNFNTALIDSGQTSYTLTMKWSVAQRSIRMFFRSDGINPITPSGTGDTWYVETDLLDAQQLQLYQVDAGGTPTLRESATVTFSGGETIKIIVTPTDMSVEVDGTGYISHASSTHGTNTFVGLGTGPGTPPDHVDDFLVTYSAADAACTDPTNPVEGSNVSFLPCNANTFPGYTWNQGESITAISPGFYIWGCEGSEGTFTHTMPSGISLGTNANGIEVFTGAPISTGTFNASVTCDSAVGTFDSITQFFTVTVNAGATEATGYFVDPDNGLDTNAGTSDALAWKTCEKINSGTYNSGDIVYLKAGATADCTTTTGVQLNWASAELHPYYVQTGTEFKGRNGLSRPVIRSTSTTVNPLDISGAGVTVGEVATDWDSVSATAGNVWDIDITGDGTTLDGTHGNGATDGNAATTDYLAGKRRGWVRVNADNTTITNWFAGAYSWQTVRVQAGSSRWYITNGEQTDTFADSIRINTDGTTPQYGLVSNNTLTCGRISDSFQTNNSTFGGGNRTPDNRNVTVRNNRFNGSATSGGTCENHIDPKGGINIWVYDNIVYGSQGDNNGQDADTNDRNTLGAYTVGSGQDAEKLSTAFNIVYDSAMGIKALHGNLVFNNTVLGNNRDYTGSNSGLPDGSEQYLGVGSTSGAAEIRNNLIAGNRSSEVSTDIADGATDLAVIDYNLYWDTDGNPEWHDNSADTRTATFATWQGWLSGAGIGGADANSSVADPLITLGVKPEGPHPVSSFLPSAGSPTIDAAAALTTATTTASGTTVTVANSCYVYGGNGITGESGWYIKIGATAVVQVTSSGCEDPITPVTTTLEIAESRSWNSGDEIFRATSGGDVYNDIGACDDVIGCPSVPAIP